MLISPIVFSIALQITQPTDQADPISPSDGEPSSAATDFEIPPPPPILMRPPPPPPPASSTMGRPPVPKNQGRWASRIAEGYPTWAEVLGYEGTVGVRVTVGSNGRVQTCMVTASSGHSILDSAACRDMTRYARFQPALGDDGNPTRGPWSTRIRYAMMGDLPSEMQLAWATPLNPRRWGAQIVADYPMAAQLGGLEGRVDYTLLVDTDGEVANCQVTRSSGYEALDVGTCKSAKRHARFEPGRDANGDLVQTKWSGTVTYELK